MKKFLISMMFLLAGVLVCQADEPQKFSPEKFQAEMEQFITKEAGLTAEEGAKFFPIYRVPAASGWCRSATRWSWS